MQLTAQLSSDRRDHVEGRLQSNLIAWLTTVQPQGQPVTVPVWFLLRADGTILVYSQPNKAKIRNIEHNPQVALGLDVTDLGRDVIRVNGVARKVNDVAPAHQNPPYVVKYAERIGALFGTPEAFSALFSDALLITPTRLWA